MGTVWLARVVPKGFIPSEDQNQLSATTEAQEGISFDAMVQHQQAMAAIIQRDSNVAGLMSSVGGGGRSDAMNQGRMLIQLKPRSQRRLDADGVARELSARAAAVPGIRFYVQNPPVINIGGRRTKSLYQFTLQGADIDALYQSATALEARLRDLPELVDVSSDLQLRNPEARVEINRDRAASLRHLHGADPDRPCTTPTAPGRCPPSTPRPTSTGWCWNCCRSISGTFRRCSCCRSTRPQVRWCRSPAWPR